MTASAEDTGLRIRVTAGNPGPAEVAAVTVALLALVDVRARRAATTGPSRRAVTWTGPGGFQSPASWAAERP